MSLADAFADAVARLHLGSAGDPSVTARLRQAASLVWQAAGEGHACVAIDDAGLREALAASPAVAAPRSEAGAPLVLDGDVVYLQRLWQAEASLALGLHTLDAPAPLAAPAAAQRMLGALAPPDELDARQRAVVADALTRRLVVVTGGPGTGKTTTIARLLVACARLAPELRVAIAAPTGKAAARLAQALAAQLDRLDPEHALAGRLPGTGMTVHRLLGLRGDESLRPAATQRYDLVIVDEASMLDLELARILVEWLPQGGRLVLAGDQDQLASVEAGAVFAGLCASGLAGITRLERNYRQAGAPALTALANWLRDGGRSPGCAAPFDPAAAVLRLDPGPGPIAARSLLAWEPAFAAIEAGASAAAILAAFDRHRVLCALREGPLGSIALNAAIAARVRRRLAAPPGALWYPGRLVMVTRNRPELDLANGDVGVCVPLRAREPSALAVAFDAGGEAVRMLPVRQLPGHEDAFAMTVHKSQGSEFDTVALVPGPAGHRLNTRELLYTGATRARQALTVWAEAGVLEEGARRCGVRHGRLADRIAALRAAGRPSSRGGRQ